MAAAMPVEKSMNFGPSAKRLLGRFGTGAEQVIAVVLLAVASVVLGGHRAEDPRPRDQHHLRGHHRQAVPAGTTANRLPAQRAAGNDQLADVLAKIDFVPGQGIDFDRARPGPLARLALFIGASLLMWLQGYLLNLAVVQQRPAAA